MAILGPYTGNPEKASSYCYGPHWMGYKGYKVVQGSGDFKHRFGGNDWEVPLCKNCNEQYHQIITLDLSDQRLSELQVDGLRELPMVSCLNCSTAWQPQVFKIDIENRSLVILSSQDTQNWKQDDDCKIESPLPEVHMHLVDMTDDDVPVNHDTYYNILDDFGSNYICRLLGAPLYVQSPIDRECPICKREMMYVALIGSQNFDEKGKVIKDFDFFLGEMNLYFMFCRNCMIIKTECQGT